MFQIQIFLLLCHANILQHTRPKLTADEKNSEVQFCKSLFFQPHSMAYNFSRSLKGSLFNFIILEIPSHGRPILIMLIGQTNEVSENDCA